MSKKMPVILVGHRQTSCSLAMPIQSGLATKIMTLGQQETKVVAKLPKTKKAFGINSQQHYFPYYSLYLFVTTHPTHPKKAISIAMSGLYALFAIAYK